MKNIKKEILLILIILSVQIIVSFLISFFLNKVWNVRVLICNYTFWIFWGTYLIAKALIALIKKYSRDI